MSTLNLSNEATPKNLAWGQTWPNPLTFAELAKTRRVIPVVRHLLADELSAVGVYRQLGEDKPGTFILESGEHDGSWGRWSFVGCDSLGAIVYRDGQASWHGESPAGALQDGSFVDVVHSALTKLHGDPIEGLPPLTGALVGNAGWGIISEWEPTLTPTAPREMNVPDASFVLASKVAAINHHDGSIWLVSVAWNMNGNDARVNEAYEAALRGLDDMEQRLASPIRPAVLSIDPQCEFPEVVHRSERGEYEASVRAAQRAIEDGEVFQIVLSQRLDVQVNRESLDVYRVLRTINPSPYMFYLRLPDGLGATYDVIGSSPETLVKKEGERVWTYPIAGSRPRGTTGAEDHDLAAELLEDPKELSEHVMLVDLARNDLSKVCDPATVEVSTLMEIKRFSHIQHISSTVTGLLRDDVDALDCLVATFPAGTLSGAPKPRAIRLIDDFEPAARGVYGGVVGYFDLSGDADLAIAIRTASVSEGVASVQSGAGIVIDSVPATEYIETRNKAAASVQAVRIAQMLRSSSE